MKDELLSQVDRKICDILNLFEQMAIENERINGREIPDTGNPYNTNNYIQLVRFNKGTRKHYVQLAFFYGELYAVKCLREMATTYYGPSGESND